MYIDRQRIKRAAYAVAYNGVRDNDLADRVIAIYHKSRYTEFFSEQDVLTLEKVELAEMGLNGVCA